MVMAVVCGLWLEFFVFGGRVVADVVPGVGQVRAVVGGGERVVARAEVVRRGLGLPAAREDALLVATHSSYGWMLTK